jgi:two-component system chemotaxis response regulator CheY
MAMRVLLIDDSVMVRDVLRNHVECLGGSVVAEAENTLQALDLFRTVEPDLVILDVAVSQTGGIGALALFRIIRNEIPAMPVLVISGLALPDLRRSFLKEGALDYLFKPFNPRTFAQLRNLLVERFPELAYHMMRVRNAGPRAQVVDVA